MTAVDPADIIAGKLSFGWGPHPTPNANNCARRIVDALTAAGFTIVRTHPNHALEAVIGAARKHAARTESAASFVVRTGASTALRDRDKITGDRLMWCSVCLQDWPCETARALALLDDQGISDTPRFWSVDEANDQHHGHAVNEQARRLNARCAICDRPFTTVEWDDWHDHPDGWVHAKCCPCHGGAA